MTADAATVENDLDDLAAARERTLAMVHGLSQGEFDWRPDERRWSVGEVADHLLRVERFVQRDLGWLEGRARAGLPAHIHHTFRDLDLGLRGIPRGVMPLLDWPLTFATLFLPSSVLNAVAGARLIPLRHPTMAEPERGRPADDLRRELRDSFVETAGRVGRLGPYDVSRMTVSHPMLGTRTVPQLLRFVAQHERRHQGQIGDLIGDSTPRVAPARTPRGPRAGSDVREAWRPDPGWPPDRRGAASDSQR